MITTDKKDGLIYMVLKLWGILSAYRKRQFILLLALMVLTSLGEGISLGMVAPFISIVLNPDSEKNMGYIGDFANFFGITEPHELVGCVAFLFGLMFIISGALRFFSLLFSAKLSNEVGGEIVSEIFRRTLLQPYEVHITRNSSEIIAGIAMKANGIVYYTIFPLLIMLNSAMMIITIICALIYVNPTVAISLFFGFTLIYIAVSFITRKMTIESGILSNKCSVQQIKSMQEGLGSIRDIILDGTHDLFCEIFNKADSDLRSSHAKLQIIGGCPKYFIEAIGLALIAAFTYFLSAQENIGLELFPILGALAMAAQRLLPLFQQFYSSYTSLSGGIPSLRDTLDLLTQPLPIRPFVNSNPKLAFKKDVVLENIRFKYSNGEDDVLGGINLHIQKGDRIGLIGKTGGGKSTLLDVFMQLLIQSNGRILVDGVEIVDGNRKAWQKIIAHVPQNIYLADTSIAQNLAFGEKLHSIDIDRLRMVANTAQISQHIESLPLGYDTIVGENGVKMSGGQRQRIGIARALYKKSEIIVLDEATSALDSITEENVMESMKLWGKNLTILIIAHRHKTLKNCNKVYRLSNGNVQPVSQSEL